MKIILGYWTFSNCTETHPSPLEGHVFDKEDNGKKLVAVTISPFSFTMGRNVNFLEDTFFHHSFVVQSIEEPRDQSRCLVPEPAKTKEPGAPSQRQLLSCELQSRFAAKGGGGGGGNWDGMREAKGGNRWGEFGAHEWKSRKEKIEVAEERNEKRNFHHGGGWGECGSSTFLGSEQNKTTTKRTESLLEWFCWNQKPSLGLMTFWEKYS